MTPPVATRPCPSGSSVSCSSRGLRCRCTRLLSAALRARASSSRLEDLVRVLAARAGPRTPRGRWSPCSMSSSEILSSSSRCSVRTLAGHLVGLVDHPADLGVDLLGGLVGVLLAHAVVAAHEGLRRVVAEGERTQVLAHAVLGDHAPGRLGGPLQVVGRAGGDVVEADLLGHPAGQHVRQLVDDLLLLDHELVFGGQGDGVAQRLPAADDGDLVHRVGVGQVVRHQRVAGLVIGGDELLLLGEEARLLLRAGDDPQDRLFELLHLDDPLAPAGGQQGGLVHQVGQVGAGEARGLRGQGVEVDARGQRLALGVHRQDGLAALRGRDGRRRSAGRSGPGAAAPGRGCRAGWWPP